MFLTQFPPDKDDFCCKTQHRSSLSLWEFNKIIPPLQATSWRSLDPHFGNRCPDWLIKLLYVRVPYGPARITESTCSEALARTPPSFYGGLAINTITAIGLRVSLYARLLSGFLCVLRIKARKVEMTNSANFPFFWESESHGGTRTTTSEPLF